MSNLANRESREAFLQYVKQYTENDPEISARIPEAVQAGIRDALAKSQERAADMETIVATLASRRYKGSDDLILDKLNKWDGKTSLLYVVGLLDKLNKAKHA